MISLTGVGRTKVPGESCFVIWFVTEAMTTPRAPSGLIFPMSINSMSVMSSPPSSVAASSSNASAVSAMTATPSNAQNSSTTHKICYHSKEQRIW